LSDITVKINTILAPYAGVTLSAFDTLKLIVSVITASMATTLAADTDAAVDNATSQDIRSLPIGYEASRTVDVAQSGSTTELGLKLASESFFCVQWQGMWIDCGLTNDYSVELGHLSAVDNLNTEALREMSVPVLSLQQVAFMCLPDSHFDHC